MSRPIGRERVAPVIAVEREGTVNHVEARKAAACKAFWSDAPLNIQYREAVGDRSFSLKEFVEFVVAMPPDQFLAATRE